MARSVVVGRLVARSVVATSGRGDGVMYYYWHRVSLQRSWVDADAVCSTDTVSLMR